MYRVHLLMKSVELLKNMKNYSICTIDINYYYNRNTESKVSNTLFFFFKLLEKNIRVL